MEKRKISQRGRLANTAMFMFKEAVALLEKISELPPEDIKWVQERLEARGKENGLEQRAKELSAFMDKKVEDWEDGKEAE